MPASEEWNGGGLTLHRPVFVTGDVPLLSPGSPGDSEGVSAIRTSSVHCLELSTVPKQWHVDVGKCDRHRFAGPYIFGMNFRFKRLNDL